MYYKDKSSLYYKDNNLNQFFSAQPDLNIKNFNKLFTQFAHIILSTIDTHAPLKSLTKTKKKLKSKPWITKGIFASIRKKKTTNSNLIL